MSLKEAVKKKQKRSEEVNMALALNEATQEPKKRLNANIPESTYKALRIKAMQEGTTINNLVHNWVNEYLSK